jgi:hypothetical protein
MKHLKKFESFKDDFLSDGIKDRAEKLLHKGADFAKDVWRAVKRESRETKEALRLLSEISQGNEITDIQKEFIKAQAIDLAKAVPLIAISGLPVPIPITPFLIIIGKKVGFDFLPNSHTKVNYQVKEN